MLRIALVVCLALLFPMSSLARQATPADTTLAARFAAVPTDYAVHYTIILGKGAYMLNTMYSSGRSTSAYVSGAGVYWEVGMIPNKGDTLYTTHKIGLPLMVVPRSLAASHLSQLLEMLRATAAGKENQAHRITGPLERL